MVLLTLRERGKASVNIRLPSARHFHAGGIQAPD